MASLSSCHTAASCSQTAARSRHLQRAACVRPAAARSQDCQASTSGPTSSTWPQLLKAGTAALAAAAVLVASPLAAQAVSGGGGISTPLSGSDFSGQDLTRKSYTKAVLRKTNFEKANLTGVSLFGCLAEGSSFRGANLTNADLESGNFEGADFTGAVLAGAYVNNAQLQGAKIDDTDWSDVVLRKDQQMFLCSIAAGTNPVTGVDTRESLVCP